MVSQAHLTQGMLVGGARGMYSDDTSDRYARLAALLIRLSLLATACSGTATSQLTRTHPQRTQLSFHVMPPHQYT